MLLVLACETAPNPPEKGDIGNGNTPPTPEEIAMCATGCEDIVDPVCGLDGVIYSNECIARCTGTAIDPDGECAVC
ncbi:MAG: Kazal-type serine protease inhibitor domain-containing protein, partial [Bacteroidia bacterium]